MEYPCEKCIVRAICRNLSCKLLEEYLTHIYRNYKVLSKEEYEKFDKTVPSDIKRVIVNFNMRKTVISKKFKYGLLESCEPTHFSRIEFIVYGTYMVHKTVGEEIKIVYLR